MTFPRILGLHSPAPQSGKSTVAAWCQSHGYVVVPFAGALKDVARTMLDQLGLTRAEIDRAMSGDKSTPVYQGVTCRHLLQTLGTEWGRTHLGQQVWVDCWRARANRLLSAGHRIVADDVRFANEARAIHDLHGQVWQIVRPGASGAGTHASEAGLPGQLIDLHILNAGPISELHDQLALLAR